jgi:hypothetical protein
MFLWDRGVARNPWLPDPENCPARLLVAPNALEFSFPLLLGFLVGGFKHLYFP